MRNKQIIKLVLSALFITLSFVLTRFFVLPPGPTLFRFTLGSVPIIIASLLLGPVYGGLVGIGADVIGALLFPSGTFLVFPVISSMLYGVLPYFFMRLINLLRLSKSVPIISSLGVILYSLLLVFVWTSSESKSIITKETIIFDTTFRIWFTIISALVLILIVTSLFLVNKYMGKRNKGKITFVYEIAFAIALTDIIVDIIYTSSWKTLYWELPFFFVLAMHIIIFVTLLPLKTLFVNLIIYAFEKSGISLLSPIFVYKEKETEKSIQE
jgi:ECF transporter S component (folate family)